MGRVIHKLLVCLCTLSSVHSSNRHNEYAFDEMRLEISDFKHALNGSKVELQILEEKVHNQERLIASLKSQLSDTSKNSTSSGQLAALEKRIVQLEKLQEKITADLRQMSTYASQCLTKLQQVEQEVGSQEKRLEEVGKLKDTLTSISKAINPRSASEKTASKSYRVKAGDSLEKIAKLHHSTVDTIKALNNLAQDKIVVGQELKVPSDGQ